VCDNVPGTEEINVQQELNIVRYNKAIFIVISVKLLHFRHFSTIFKRMLFLILMRTAYLQKEKEINSKLYLSNTTYKCT
jgi:hypothetical protein